jgi:hypothetical protein
MSAEYVSDAAEIERRKPAANADNLNVVKILEYGDNIENRRSRQFLRNPRETALHAQLYHPANYWCSSSSNDRRRN